MGRTIDTALQALTESDPGDPDSDRHSIAIDELTELKYALDDCNRACKNADYPNARVKRA